MRLQTMTADHRGQGERHGSRDDDGEGECQGKGLEEAPDDAAEEKQRNEGCQERKADRDHRETDLARALDRSLHRLHPGFEIGVDILDHHDRVVDDESDGDRERHQRQIVDRQARSPHCSKGAGK
jgi:hypothetical protein